ncbi:hypothetical protein [Methanosarcina sp. 2.H.T.1A.3]|nr:hypothetical protein [Methanosarcina sp. 2.H.T.1A.3]
MTCRKQGLMVGNPELRQNMDKNQKKVRNQKQRLERAAEFSGKRVSP